VSKNLEIKINRTVIFLLFFLCVKLTYIRGVQIPTVKSNICMHETKSDARLNKNTLIRASYNIFFPKISQEITLAP